MKKCFKKTIKIALILISIVFVSGCWNSRELNTLSIVLGIGIDQSQEAGKIDLTVQTAKTSSSKSKKDSMPSASSSGDNEAYQNLKLTCDTVFNGFREFTHQNSRKLFIPQNQVIIFGEDLAKEGIEPYVDFLSRDHETRMDVYVLVAENTADEILNIEPSLEKMPAVELKRLIEAQSATSHSIGIELIELVEKIESDTTAALATLVSKSENEGTEKMYVSGMAVFKKDKMVGTLSDVETRGYLWVSNKIKSGILEIKIDEGTACLEIKKSKCKMKIEMTDDKKLKIELTVSEEGTIGELSGFKDLELIDIIEILKKEGAKVIEDEIYASIDKAKILNADYFGFGDMFNKKYSKKFETFKDDWDEEFRNIEVSVKVETKITGSGMILDLNLMK